MRHSGQVSVEGIPGYQSTSVFSEQVTKQEPVDFVSLNRFYPKGCLPSAYRSA